MHVIFGHLILLTAFPSVQLLVIVWLFCAFDCLYTLVSTSIFALFFCITHRSNIINQVLLCCLNVIMDKIYVISQFFTYLVWFSSASVIYRCFLIWLCRKSINLAMWTYLCLVVVVSYTRNYGNFQSCIMSYIVHLVIYGGSHVGGLPYCRIPQVSVISYCALQLFAHHCLIMLLISHHSWYCRIL